MNRNALFLAASVLCIGLTGLGFALQFGPYVRTVMALPLVFVLPGAALLRALRVEVPAPGRYALVVGMSAALCLVGGLLLAAIGLLTPLGWMLWLGGTTLAGAGAALRHGGAERLVWRPTFPKIRHAALAGASLAVVVATGVVTVRNREAALPFPYANFWMLPDEPGSRLYTIGVKNAERDAQRFAIRVLVDGAIVAIWAGLDVAPQETVTRTVMLPAGRKAEAWLLRGSAPAELYRQVSASLPQSVVAARD